MRESSDVNSLIARVDFAFQERGTYESTMQEIRDFVRPFARSFTATDVLGGKDRDKIFDGSGEFAAEILESTVHGELANPADRWFELSVGEPQIDRRVDVAAWYEDTENRMYRIFGDRRSRWGFDNAPWFGECCDYGTSVMELADRPGDIPLYRATSMVECAIEENAEGVVDTLYRKFRLPAERAVGFFGDHADGKAKKAAASESAAEQTKPMEYARIVRPMGDTDGVGRKFSSHYVSLDSKEIVRIEYFFEFPFAVPRWRVRGAGEGYGRGSGHRALADIKTLQRAMYNQMRGVEKTIDPALMMPDDGVFGPVVLSSGAINVYSAQRFMFSQRKPIEPIDTGSRPDVGDVFMDGIRARVDAAYYGPLLRTPRDPRMLQDQILDIQEERARVLGPIFERIQTEGLDVIVDRTLAIGLRRGLFLPPPAALEGREVRPVFRNPFAQARAVSTARAIQRFLNMNLPLADRKPEVLDNLNEDEAFRQSGEGLNVPATIFRDPRAVAKMRQERQERIAAMEQAQIAEQTGKAAQMGAQAAQTFQGAA